MSMAVKANISDNQASKWRGTKSCARINGIGAAAGVTDERT